MEMKKCRTCKEEIKAEAQSCPYCGEKDQSGVFVVLGGIVFFVFVGLIGLAVISALL